MNKQKDNLSQGAKAFKWFSDNVRWIITIFGIIWVITTAIALSGCHHYSQEAEAQAWHERYDSHHNNHGRNDWRNQKLEWMYRKSDEQTRLRIKEQYPEYNFGVVDLEMKEEAYAEIIRLE